MNEDWDPHLAARFARAAPPAHADEFLAGLLARASRQRRRARRGRALAATLAVLLLGWQSPALLAISARIADRLVSGPVEWAIPAPQGPSFAGWLVSLLIGALVLWRRTARRR